MLMGGSSKQPSTTGGPTVSLGQDSHSTPAAKSVAASWSVQAGGDAPTVVGSWLVDNKSIVRGDTGALKAYDAESGKSLWAFPAPGQGSAICGMSQLAIRKIGLVQSGPAGNCNTVTAISTDTGKQVWTAAVAAPPGSPAGTVPLTSFGGDVAAGQAGTSVTVWSAADGHQLWTADLAKANPACRLEQLGVKGAYVTMIEDCGAGPVVAAKDAHSGNDLWHAALPPDGLNGAQVTLVQAAFPTIVHVASQGAQPFDKYYSFDTKGKPQGTISGSADFGALDLNTGPQGQQHPLPHVQDTTLVAPTADKDTNAALVAFDLGSGNKVWQTPAVASGPVTIAGLDANKVTVFDGGAAGSPARLLAFSTKSGAPVASGISGTLGSDWSGPAAAAYITGDRLILLPAAPEKGADVLAFALG
jgi:outer membrane protein assembly factor BamB